MATCEMCGSDSNSLTIIKVAGSTMSVCSSCRKMGSDVFGGGKSAHTFKRSLKSELIETVIPNFQSEIQKGMNKKKIDVHQLARVINIKESTLNNYLSGKIKPDLSHAKKIGIFLDVYLIEEINSSSSDEDFMSDNSSSSSLSLGDLIKKQMESKK